MKARRILIVDDSRGVRNALTLMLSPHGFDCVQAEDGVRALEVLSAEHVDAVLTDLHMPELDGLELLRFMRRDSALHDTPVFVLTGDGHEEAVEELVHAGATGVLRKPVSRDQLVATLQECLG